MFKIYQKLTKAAFAAFCVGSSTFAVGVYAASLFASGQLLIQTKNGSVQIAVEIADNDAKRSQGLMFRQNLGEHAGMLFLFDRDEQISMWMKNTYIPLDMVFIDKTWRIVKIAKQTEPLSTEVISSGQASSRVLEINGGEAEKLSLHVGDEVVFKN